jgi:hypothetical protein
LIVSILPISVDNLWKSPAARLSGSLFERLFFRLVISSFFRKTARYSNQTPNRLQSFELKRLTKTKLLAGQLPYRPDGL